MLGSKIILDPKKILYNIYLVDKEVVWMLSHYVLYVWDNVHVKESDVKLEQFIGYLKFKFKESPIKLKNLQIFM